MARIGFISRPLGLDVTLAQARMVPGLYAVFALGGGGGGGGYQSNFQWYGTRGDDGSLVGGTLGAKIYNPVALEAGPGGGPGAGNQNGYAGESTLVTNLRGVTSGAGLGGLGGLDANSARNQINVPQEPYLAFGKTGERGWETEPQLGGSYTTTAGRGGASTGYGSSGGIVRIVRIG